MNRKKLITRTLMATCVIGLGAAAITLPAQAEQETSRVATEADPFNSTDEMVDEYRDALDDPSLEFPVGVALPDAPNVDVATQSARGEAGSTFEPGYGEVEAADVWRCAWQYSLLAALEKGDQRSAETAGQQLAKFYEIDAVEEFVVDPGHHWYSDVVQSALSGSTKTLEEDLALNCNPDIGD